MWEQDNADRHSTISLPLFCKAYYLSRGGGPAFSSGGGAGSEIGEKGASEIVARAFRLSLLGTSLQKAAETSVLIKFFFEILQKKI